MVGPSAEFPQGALGSMEWACDACSGVRTTSVLGNLLLVLTSRDASGLSLTSWVMSSYCTRPLFTISVCFVGLACLVVDPFSVPVCASVVDEEPASGGGDVVGVGVVDFDVVDGLDGAGRLDGVEVDGLSGVVAEGVFCGELAGGGEAFALDVEGVGCCGGDLAGAGGHAQGRHVVVCEGCGDGCCGGLSGGRLR